MQLTAAHRRFLTVSPGVLPSVTVFNQAPASVCSLLELFQKALGVFGAVSLIYKAGQTPVYPDHWGGQASIPCSQAVADNKPLPGLSRWSFYLVSGLLPLASASARLLSAHTRCS